MEAWDFLLKAMECAPTGTCVLCGERAGGGDVQLIAIGVPPRMIFSRQP